VGYDLAEGAIVDGRAEASRMGLGNLRFDVLDVAKLSGFAVNVTLEIQLTDSRPEDCCCETAFQS
jgi:hypothetical protein